MVQTKESKHQYQPNKNQPPFPATVELVTVEILSGLDPHTSHNDTLGDARAVAAECRCLPACTSIEYEAETSQADYDWKAIYRAYKLPIEEDIDE